MARPGAQTFGEPLILPHDSKTPVNVARYTLNGAYILTGGTDRKINLWNSKSGTLVKGYSESGYSVLGIAITPDNSKFASCGDGRDVSYWDVSEGSVIRRFSGHSKGVNAVAFNFDGTVLASGGSDGTVRFWDCKSQQRMPIQILEEATDSVTCVRVQGSEVVTGSVDGYVRSYDLRKGQKQSDFFEQPVTSVSLLSDSKTFLVSTLNSTIRLMDREKGELLQTFKGHRNDAYRCGADVGGISETSLVAGDEDGSLWVWDLASAKVTATISKAHSKLITWVEHHPKNDTQIVTTGADGCAKLWSSS